jgi:hypothetical protein
MTTAALTTSRLRNSPLGKCVVSRCQRETITKWGLGGFLLLVYIPLHPREPATKCRAQITV